MKSLYALVVSVLAITPLASVQAFGAVLTRDDGEAYFPEPRVFHNLTMDEYRAKLLEHRGASHTKRVAVGGESRNAADQQALVERISAVCRTQFGNEYRFRRADCYGTDTLVYWCDKPSDDATVPMKRTTKPCRSTKKKPLRCEKKGVWNHRGSPTRAVYCADIIVIEEKEEEVDAVPQYDGYKTLPYEAWSPGSIDAFYEMTGTPFPGLTGNFEYRGHYSNGQEFRSLSPKQAHSWACLDCPSGTLYVSTVGFRSEAVGFNVPAGSWY